MELTPRENALRAYRRQTPERIPDLRLDCHSFLLYELNERGPAQNEQQPDGGGGFDWYGVKWKFVPVVGAPMVDPSEPHVMEDITEWRDKVHFPDLDAIDWAAAAARDLNNPNYDPDKLRQVIILNGPFERLHALMGMENALCALLTDPEACYDYFGAFMDFKIRLMDRILEHYPIDLFHFHDDLGHQRNSFFSPDLFRALLQPHFRRLAAHMKEKGVILQWHSCGYVENLIPDMLDAGIEHWSSCQTVNDIQAIARNYGDRLTILGGFDLNAYRAPDLSPARLEALVGARIDDLCRGGAVFPYPASTIPGLGEAISSALQKRRDFYKDPKNRMLPN